MAAKRRESGLGTPRTRETPEIDEISSYKYLKYNNQCIIFKSDTKIK
jgi:hypothetical protein